MLLVPTQLSSSSIHGIGVFAAIDIPAGTQIWTMDERFDRVIPESLRDEVPALTAEFIDIYCYPSQAHPGHYILETDNGRFMNHSETPNTDFNTPGKGIAKRLIKKGEEILCDYREFFEGFQGYDQEAEQAA